MNKSTKILLMLLGIFILGVSISFLRYGALGTDPYTTMNLGVSSAVGLSFGVYQMFINFILFILVLLFKRETIGIGTIVNMIMVGYTSDIVFFYLLNEMPAQPVFLLRLTVTVLATALACVGISMYMEAELGIAPYDALAILIIDKSNQRIPFFVARMFVDILAVIIGFNFGAVVGIGTLMLAVLTGPLVQLIREKIIKPILTNKFPVAEIK
ncbi:YczE/YyaS/YitT family protein [Alkalibacterium sp. f15]|uniref:YczE/YyaS/YitT family protein n=1 Tax=Alkalibacterium sp. f15 TaxID=3414029 RepID=UPI003BF816B4